MTEVVAGGQSAGNRWGWREAGLAFLSAILAVGLALFGTVWAQRQQQAEAEAKEFRDRRAAVYSEFMDKAGQALDALEIAKRCQLESGDRCDSEKGAATD